ncbi:MAG: ATP-binding protein [Clostridia bacterium]|nr:ATP-binding protein [Clostridia bacterium]
MNRMKKVYPFTAIVGQEKKKKALILNIINPLLGGVLIRGEKGTAKSTAVRALAELLPEREQVCDCLFGCDPNDNSSMCDSCTEKKAKGQKFGTVLSKMRVIDLPVSATEDRVVGTLDIEHAIKYGEKKFEPGILAHSNRNILYVDEVNLLDDHVVDVLLDSAAMGVNTIEREGISFSHPAKFILVGTMNPEEGDLRPQLLDRFGLAVDVVGERDTAQRMEVIRRRLEFEEDPDSFALKFEGHQQELRERILSACQMLKKVRYDDIILDMAARISIELGVDGHRADIGMIKTAITIAAYNHREFVSGEDMLEAAELVLPHRMRRRPFEEGVMELSRVEGIIEAYGVKSN